MSRGRKSGFGWARRAARRWFKFYQLNPPRPERELPQIPEWRDQQRYLRRGEPLR